VAAEDGFAETDLVVAVGGGGEEDRGGGVGGDVLIDGAVVHFVAVAEAFGVAAGVVGEAGDVVGEARGAALEDLVGFVAAADVDFVGLLEIPADTAMGAVDADGETAFPAGGDLGDSGVGVDVGGEAVRGVGELEEDAGEVFGIDRVGCHGGGVGGGEGFDFACGAETGFVEGFEGGEDARGFGSEDEGDGVDPMGADVADGAEFTAFAGEEAPVVVGFLEEPVLEEVALDVDDAAEVAALDHGAHLEDGWEEAAHVIDGEDAVGGGGGFDDFGGVAAVHAEGFFADDVFTGFEGGDGLLDVLIVRRGDVDDIDFRAGDEGFVVVVAEDVGDAPLGGGGGGAGGGTADGGDLDAEAIEGFDVDWADEAGADDTGAEVGEGGAHGGCVGGEGVGWKAKSCGDGGMMCVLAGLRGAGMNGGMMTTHDGRKDEDPDDDVQMVVKFCIPARSILSLVELVAGEAEAKR